MNLYESGMTHSQIAEQLNVSYQRVFYIVRVRKEMARVNTGKKDKHEELLEQIIKLYNEGLSQKTIAETLNKSQPQISMLIGEIRCDSELSALLNYRKRGGKPGYTQDQRKAIMTEVIDLYNSGLTVIEVGARLNKSASSVEQWIREARKEGFDVLPPMRLRNQVKEECEEPDSTEIAVVDDKNNGTNTTQELEIIESDKDKRIDDVIDTVKVFANSHLMLGKHIEKMFELINKGE